MMESFGAANAEQGSEPSPRDSLSDPDPPDHGIGRRLRWFSGVDERLLDWVPTERARYTALGGVVVGTAVLAGVSSMAALSEAFGGFRWFFVPIALIWMLFIGNLDRWLISTSSGTQWHKRLSVFLPRLLLAVFFGFIIAEPLVLKIFEPQIVSAINSERDTELRDLGGRLRQCNPTSGALPSSTFKCATAEILPLPANPQVIAADTIRLQEQLESLKSEVEGLRTQYADLNELARRECNGTSGDGLSGEYGNGVNCARLRGEADSFKIDSGLSDKEAKLDELRKSILKKSDDLQTAETSYEGELNAAIDQAVQLAAKRQEAIGLIDRFDALSALSAESFVVRVAQWAVRGLFIIVDCLPVLVKMLSGITQYERIQESHARNRRTVLELLWSKAEFTARTEADVDRHRSYVSAINSKRDIDYDLKNENADRDMRLRQEIRNLAEQYLSTSGLASHRTIRLTDSGQVSNSVQEVPESQTKLT